MHVGHLSLCSARARSVAPNHCLPAFRLKNVRAQPAHAMDDAWLPSVANALRCRPRSTPSALAHAARACRRRTGRRGRAGAGRPSPSGCRTCAWPCPACCRSASGARPGLQAVARHCGRGSLGSCCVPGGPCRAQPQPAGCSTGGCLLRRWASEVCVMSAGRLRGAEQISLSAMAINQVCAAAAAAAPACRCPVSPLTQPVSRTLQAWRS